MIQLLKRNISLVDLIQKDLGVELKPVGSLNFGIADEKDNGGCPFCSHFDCFRVKVPEGQTEQESNEGSFFKCFSCGKHGDAIAWRVERAGGEDKLSVKDAIFELAKEYKVSLPREYNPIQEVFTLAARYYHTCLIEECRKKLPELGGLTPIEYQTTVRGHDIELLKREAVGFSDGGLRDFLEGVGIDEEVMLDSGLINRRTGKDYLPNKCFIYPHRVKGQVSHFTFKDPTKRLAFQLPKKFSLNGYTFYGQDSVSSADTVLVVEGENDRLSAISAGATGVIATIGQISTEQMEWMRDNLSAKKVLTCFDGDDAGDKYRVKLEKCRRYFVNLGHVRPPQGSDIDEQIRKFKKTLPEIIKEGFTKVDLTAEKVDEKPDLEVPWDAPDRKGSVVIPPVTERVEKVEKVKAEEVEEPASAPSMASLLEGTDLGLPGKPSPSSPSSPALAGQGKVQDTSGLDETVEMDQNPVLQHKGCYYKVTYKDGVPDYVKLSDFTIKLKNVFLNESGGRDREVVVVKQNGYVSDPFLVDSETKVSVKPFRTLVAKAADAEWMGSETDLCGMWRLVYRQDSDVLVRVPRTVGRHERYGCWIFRNCLITDNGVVVQPDKDGIFWVNGKSLGVRPESLNSNYSREERANGDIPGLEMDVTREEADELMETGIRMLAQNLSGKEPMTGYSLMMMGWAWANVYADLIFKINRGFPFLMMWGTNGKGKTTLGKWLQNFFGTAEHGSTTVPQLKSGVGWGRKAEYYSCLPLMVDEVRSNDETRQYLGMFRAYYDREGRTLGTKADFGVRTQAVRAGFIFCGEDQFEDPATRERCIPLRIPAIGRETFESFKWFEDRAHLFTAVTYYRILDWCAADKDLVVRGIRELDRKLVAAGCPPRTSKNWAAIGFFAQQLATKFTPEFDFEKWVVAACGTESTFQKDDSTLMQFFEIVEGVLAQENSKITSEHICVEGEEVHLWFPPIYKIVNDETRGKLTFSKNAVLSSLKEEPYFVDEGRKKSMGMSNTRRTVMTLNLKKAPDVVKNIAGVN
jgi:5S rRNA maturation endonuclease (ribonuclease M5)